MTNKGQYQVWSNKSAQGINYSNNNDKGQTIFKPKEPTQMFSCKLSKFNRQSSSSSFIQHLQPKHIQIHSSEENEQGHILSACWLDFSVHTYSSASSPWASPLRPSLHSRSHSLSGGHWQQPAGYAVGPGSSSLQGWKLPYHHSHAEKHTLNNRLYVVSEKKNTSHKLSETWVDGLITAWKTHDTEYEQIK